MPKEGGSGYYRYGEEMRTLRSELSEALQMPDATSEELEKAAAKEVNIDPDGEIAKKFQEFKEAKEKWRKSRI